MENPADKKEKLSDEAIEKIAYCLIQIAKHLAQNGQGAVVLGEKSGKHNDH